MIHTNRIVTVGEQESIIDRPIVLYRGDREVEIEFTLVGNEFTFSEDGNVIKSVNASHGQLVLNTPSGEHMFSELAECHEGKVVFVVTKEMIDEFVEVGFYSFQIRLYDSAEMKSRVTIPPVLNGFDIRNPIAAEDETNVVDQGIVDYARIFKDQSNEELPTFDWTGAYNKTEWSHHDVITENKMNKIEDALYSINANVRESDVVMLNALDNVKKDADKYVKEHMAEVEADVEEFERNLNTGVQKFKIDTNAAMTTHKNEVSEELEGFSSELNPVIDRVEHISRNHIYISEFDGNLQDAVDYCRANNYDLIINKDLEISDTIMVSNHLIGSRAAGIRIVGTPNRPTITLNSSSDIPAFYFYGGSGAFSNTGLENLTIVTTTVNVNTAVKINGVCHGKFHNLSMSNFKYGIHLCNDTGAGTFSELNSFTDIVLNYNTNGIRMEQLAGDASFHGNNFFNVYFNIGANQIGFNFVKGYYYNGNFRLYMWAHDASSVYLNANGTAEHNIGDITYESFKPGKFTGVGRFWFSGSIQGIGGCNTSEIVTKANGEHVIHCNNFIRGISHPTVGNIRSLWSGDHYTGINAGMYGISNDNEKSFLINGYHYGNLSKLYLGTTNINNDLDKMVPGMHINLKGNSIRTYNSEGLSIYDSDGNYCGKFDDGRIYGKSGPSTNITIEANPGVEQTITLNAPHQDSSAIWLASLKIKGANFEITRLYSVNHQGYGGAGSCTLLSNHYTLTRGDVTLKSVTVNSSGALVLTITTTVNLTVISRMQAIGSML